MCLIENLQSSRQCTNVFADSYWALVRDDVSSLQYSEAGVGLQAAPNPVHAAASEEGAPHGVGSGCHVSGAGCESA